MNSGGRTTTAEALVAMLSLGAMSGYELRGIIEESIGNFWSESFGQIYPTLKQLQANGLVCASAGARPGSKVYSLTDLGRQSFREWLGVPPQPQVMRNELLLKLFFGNHAENASVREQIEQERRSLELDLARYELIEARIKLEHGDHPGLPYWLMTVNYGKAEATALIGWCDETLAQLEMLAAKAGEAVR
jgi:DNA-binding PadR family transcriptional regulator